MPVSAVLRESLAQAGGVGAEPHHHHHLLQTQIASATKHLVLKPIDYEEYPEKYFAQNDGLKAKYILLSASDSASSGPCGVPKKVLTVQSSMNGQRGPEPTNGVSAAPKKETANNNKNELPLPKRIFFPREKVQVGWKGSDRKWQIGAGFVNVGNTCYLNSTLQALLHVPAMANWLASDSEHRDKCSEFNDGQCCIICAVSKTLLSTQTNQYAVKPWLVYSKLKMICKHLVHGRQEDAHEFLRYLIEAMEKAYLQRFKVNPNLEQYSKETTPLNQILGGYLRSSVRCLACNHISITFQHFEDLLLDIRKANTIDEALQGYFAREKLEDMGYNCEGCKKKVTATKQFSLERPPVVLCIQLKRFSMAGTKLNKQVSIKAKLDLSPYVKKAAGYGQPLSYRLVSMVTHLGASQHCGHYTAIGLTESGTYYQFDDSSVRPISLQNVLQTNAYIIFYELENGQQRLQHSNGVAMTNGNHTATVVTSSSSGTGSSGALTIKTNVFKTAPLKTNGESTKTDGATAVQENGKQNGNGSAHFNSFIGPVLPPTHPAAAKERIVFNGESSTNGNSRSKSPSTVMTKEGESGFAKGKPPSTDVGHAIVRKYPSAELLFKSPSKQSEFVRKGQSVSPQKDGDKAATSHQISPRSLVPYNSDLSSDDEEDVDKTSRGEGNTKQVLVDGAATTTVVKNGGGGPSNGQPFVKTNSGVWKVYDAVPSPQQQQNGGGGFKNNNFSYSGKGTAKVVNELLKQDHKAYGGVAVPTWSGLKSTFDKEVSSEKNLKRVAERQQDDEEMDRGKVKKLKLNQKVGRDNPGFNPFQEYQNKQQQQQAVMGPSNGNNHQAWVNNARPQGNMYRPNFKWRPGQNGNKHHNNNNKRPMHYNSQNNNRGYNSNGFKRNNFRHNGENRHGRHPKFNGGGGFRHNNNQ